MRNPLISRLGGRAAVCCVVMAALCLAAAAAPATGPTSDKDELAAGVLKVFDAKCGACHGPQARKVKKFGYVNDLVKLAANPKLLVPGDPAKSKMWTSIEEGEMPPDDTKTGDLTSDEKTLIKQWIAAGAPAGKTAVVVIAAAGPTSGPASTQAAAKPVDGPSEANRDGGKTLPLGKRLTILLGKTHPVAAHFPIALLMAAALAEALWLIFHAPALTHAMKFCTIVGGLGAIGTAALGWVNAWSHTSSSTLTAHRWLGVTAAGWAVPLLALCLAGVRGNEPRKFRLWFRLALFAGVALIGVAAHLGGALVYGEDYFSL